MANASRPLSPHLQVYRPQLTSVLSFAHRLSGIVLAGSTLFLVYWLVSLAAGATAFASAQALLSSWWCQFLLFIASFALFYHFCNGIRHLYWDTGRGLELESVYMSGWSVVIAAGILTLLTWIMAYVVA